MNSIAATARWAGIQYVLFAALAIFAHMYIPSVFYVAGDATATARRITEGLTLYRVGILATLAGQILFVSTVLTLYRLFRDVDRNQARFMVAWVCIGATVEIGNLVHRMAPLMLMSGADFLSVFSKSQLDALALGSLRLGNQVGQLLTAFWGLWLIPFGILTIRSGFFPKVLGILLFVSGIAYAATCIVRIGFPTNFPMASAILTPLYFGELGMVLWLPIMGAKPPSASDPRRQFP